MRPIPPRKQAALEIRVVDLHKSFEESEVLRGINLEVNRGELVAIVGASGSGKTVLLQNLICHYMPEPGHVFMADHESKGSPLVDVATLDEPGLERLQQHWAVVFQKNALFTGTVYDNIALGLVDVKGLEEKEIQRRATEVMKAVGLDPDEVLKLDRDELSGGMAKRAAIARALALDPVLVFYDEPTTGLDPALAHQIQDLIKEIHDRTPDIGIQRTSVIISHDTGLLKRLEPRIVMIDKGQICFDGLYDEFERSDSPIIRPYFEDMPTLHQRSV